MHPRLSVNTIGFGQVPVRDVLGVLADCGIGRVGVPVAQLESGGFAANAAALRDGGFEVADVVEPCAFSLADTTRWPAERDRLYRCVELAAEVSAPVLYLTTGAAAGLTWDEAARRFADAIAPVVRRAEATGVALAVENTVTMRADLGFVHRLSDALDVAELAGVAVCADLFAAWTDRDLGVAIAAGARSFALVQVADFVLGTCQTPDRAVPGDGDVPIARQLRWLAEAAYGGVVELELLGPRIVAEGPATAAMRGAQFVQPYL